jgi:hypothetical protein
MNVVEPTQIAAAHLFLTQYGPLLDDFEWQHDPLRELLSDLLRRSS